MLEREDFYEILKNTIIDYSKNVLAKEACCGYEPFEGSEEWVINTALGFVSRVSASKGVRTYMKSEYNVRGNLLKNAMAKLAVDVISSFPTIGSARKMYVSSGVLDKSVFISPQNRSIRFYDYDKGTVDCIVKTGFTHKYYDNQASFRQEYKYDFLNPLLDCGQGWFREPILTGHPLARTTDAQLFAKGTKKALASLQHIASDTIQMVEVSSYVQNLASEAKKKIEVASSKKTISQSDAALALTAKGVELGNSIDGQIPTCVSHGDFQAGNIWVTPEGKTLVYDWETVGRRSIWYDSATLNYSLRRATGWSSLLHDAEGLKLYDCVPKGLDAKKDIKGICGVLLLEDLLFYLDDMLELPNDWGRDVFDNFIANIKTLNWDCL